MADKAQFARREFLGKLTATITGTAALAATSSLVQSAPTETPKVELADKSKDKGYQRTEHVDTYYHLADF
ncbi:MAG: Tat pathway signal protein [Gammaproteobacteria bacterium]|nr:Tat pathway signal protein [Gammaproteobacteria bacterium]